MDLEVTEVGAGDTLVVLVHGVLDRARSFEPVAGLLATECRMVLYDRRGYGASADAAGAPVGVDVHVEDLLAVLDGRRAVVVGHSFGGMTALGAAIAAPELIPVVALYETIIAWTPGWADTPMLRVLADDDPDDAGMRLMLGDRYDTMTEEERARRIGPTRAFIEEERSVRTGTPLFDVAAVRAPIVYGTGSPETTGVVTDYLAANVPALEVMTFPGADHYIHRTGPAAFADLVRAAMRTARELSP